MHLQNLPDDICNLIDSKVAKTECVISKLRPQEFSCKYTDFPVLGSSEGIPFCIVFKIFRMIGCHFPDNCPASQSQTKGLRRCSEFKITNKTKHTFYWCEKCEDALCVRLCFKDSKPFYLFKIF